LTEFLTGAAFRRMILAGAAAIENHMTEVNDLNVFPVPDGDTGTNMTLTMKAAAEKLAGAEPKTLGEAANITAAALMRGSRGNSGVILSLLFRGVSNRLRDIETADASAFADALADGVKVAYDKVRKPTEGTMLTVSRLSADAAVSRASETRDIESVFEAAIEAGEDAVADTINLNPVLKKAGVIDSGGRGYIFILTAMLHALRSDDDSIFTVTAKAAPRETADFSAFDTGEITFTYCTEVTISRASQRSVEAFTSFLEQIGDSIAIIDDDELIKVHVHTNDPGLALTESLKYGALIKVKVENMREQHTAMIAETAQTQTESAAADTAPSGPPKKYGLIAVSPGEGLSSLMRDLGADSIISGGQTMNPSTEDILTAVESVNAETVFVFPNNKNIIWAAEQAAPLASKRVIVIPTKSVPQGISAMITFDENTDADELSEAMNNARRQVATYMITHAARDSSFDGNDIKAGHYLALSDDEMYFCGDSSAELISLTVKRIAESSPEFIVIYTGEGAEETETAQFETLLTAAAPNAEITVAAGGQPVYRYIISAE